MSDPARTLNGVSAVKLALLAKQARAQGSAIARAEPIAIIGMGCRFPGGADSPEAFWRVLRDGVDAVTRTPADRWNVDELYDPDPAVAGKTSALYAGYLDHIDTFDAEFFGIRTREAERMDPQQRLLLEVSIDALNNAGLARERLAGSRTGVFIASYHSDYAQMQYADRDAIDERTLTGTLHSVVPNRLSYLLDLRGPSVSLDAACSSSLVAVHFACQSLRAGETDMALAGGVSIIASPDLMISLSKVGFMSPSGRCHTFDAAADGFVRGEGCGVIVLKRLADAIADGDRVLSVIRSSVVNQDGHSTVLAAPNGLAQQALVREALANASIEPSRIGYVEAHGTATPLGDPIEVEALVSVLGAPRDGNAVCYLGSAKSSIGHLEAAAGVAGIIKTTLVLEHEEIPAQLHFTTLNPHISLAGTSLRVADSARPWRRGATSRIAGVSAFGVGGTNAHVIVEEAPVLPTAPAIERTAPYLLPLSAQSANALRALAGEWRVHLDTSPAPAGEICASAAARRSHYDHRLAVVGESAADLRTQLQLFLDGEHVAGLEYGTRPSAGAARLAFVFSGQGPQWIGMGRELAAQEPVFRATLADIDARFRAYASWSLIDEIHAEGAASRLDETEIAQPAIFAIQVALAALWKHWGIVPDGVVGHSIGEIAALHVAGVLSLDDAVRIVWHRARVMQQATGHGRMATTGLTHAEADAFVARFGKRLSVAAINSPAGVVLSGDADALDEALSELDQRGVSHRRLPVQYAFHSAQMAPFGRALVAALGRVDATAAAIPVYSTVTGAAAYDVAFDAGYFGRNVREPVRFASAVQAMMDDGFDAFLEVAPHPVLATSLVECTTGKADRARVFASMRRGRPERATMLAALGGVYTTGRIPEWDAVTGGSAQVLDLPAYPWQRKRYWIRDLPRVNTTVRAGEAGSVLGNRVYVAGSSDRTYQAEWPASAPAWLADHRVGERLLVPAAAMLDAFVQATRDVIGDGAIVVEDFVVHRPLVLTDGTLWQTVVKTDPADRVRVELFESVARDGLDPAWRLVASAAGARSAPPPSPEAASAPPHPTRVDRADHYARFVARGVNFGPAFQTVVSGSMAPGAARGVIEMQQDVDTTRGVHPTMLDGALQLAESALADYTAHLPVGVDRFTVFRDGVTRVIADAFVRRNEGERSIVADITLRGEDGTLVATVEGARFAAAQSGAATSDDWQYEVVWRAQARTPATVDETGAWLILADHGGTGHALAAELEGRGATCKVVFARDLDPASADAMRAVVESDDWRGSAALRGVVHLWSLDTAPMSVIETSVDNAPFSRDDALGYGSALHASQALVRADVRAPIWYVTKGAQPGSGVVTNPQSAGVWGLARVVGMEHPDLVCRIVDLGASSDGTNVAALADALLEREIVPAQALHGQERKVPRLERRRTAETIRTTAMPGRVALAIDGSGTIDSVTWRPAPELPEPRAGEVRIRVRAAGLNFRDVLLALGMYPDRDVALGAECAGVVEAAGPGVTDFKTGDAVFGFAPRSLASTVVVPQHFVARVPAGVSAETAASLPVAFLTAMYGLYRIANIGPGTRVLIHAGAGGVGMAAIQLAQRRGASVFATAGSDEKRRVLRSLGVKHVFDSRSLSFVEEIRAVTSGAGVDVVLNSLAGEFIPASVELVARGGWFLELGKRGILSAADMRRVRPDMHYVAYDLGELVHADRALMVSMMTELVTGLADESIKPIPVRAFEFAEVVDAFRLMAQAKHIGKLVLTAPDSHGSIVRSDATYVISGGTGALGLHTAEWLVLLGARNIALIARSSPSDTVASRIRSMQRAGADVRVFAADVADVARMHEVLAGIRAAMPPVSGVIHAAGTLDSGVVLQQTLVRAREVLRAKAHGAFVLHALTRTDPLDFFVLYSAAGLLLGPTGQASYAAANAELDALAHARRDAGLPALSVAWGLWRGNGMAADTERGGNVWRERGLGWIDPPDAFRRLEMLLRERATHAAVMPIDWNVFKARHPQGVFEAFFSPVFSTTPPAAAPPAARAGVVDEWRTLPAGQRRGAIIAHVAQRARHVIGLDAATPIEPGAALKDAGLDSLMAVELRNALTRSVGRSLPATLVFDYPSLDAIAAYLMRTTGLEIAVEQKDETRAAEMTKMAALTDEDAEAMLLRELETGGRKKS